MSIALHSVPIRLSCPDENPRTREPITLGLPWRRGVVREEQSFALLGPKGQHIPLQSRVLDRWSDGSIRWCLFDFLVDWPASGVGYAIEVLDRPLDPWPVMPVEASSEALRVNLGTSVVQIPAHASACAFTWQHGQQTIQADLLASWPQTENARTQPCRWEMVEQGPVRTRIAFDAAPFVSDTGIPAELVCMGYLDFWANAPVVRLSVTVRNPQSAGHPGGNWDLGNTGSFDLHRLRFQVQLPGASKIQISPERQAEWETLDAPVLLHQESSGGENWQSRNHINRERQVPWRYRGYSLDAGGKAVRTGLRATPIIMAESHQLACGLTMPSFWENFPKAVHANDATLSLDLFPEGVTELQGGEQKTHTWMLAWGAAEHVPNVLAGCRSPVLACADPEWYAQSSAVSYLLPASHDTDPGYQALVNQAIEGPDTFLAKRERIDEYGWRHFGDLYGDHEAVKHPGPEPLISHYNNQYDCVAGFAYQFLRTADPRWWSQMLECANHTCDIDIYHTDGDKPAYNRGLFWHTYHYVDADTGTHRSYPKSVRTGPNVNLTERVDQVGKAQKVHKAYAVGGGPAASHNYNNGLMLAYFLTGNPLYRETAIDLAEYVIRIEDPSRTPFRWLCWEYTGLATESGGGGYHGPGRASGNSINALLVGYQLTEDRKYLTKVEQLIRRCTHPEQNLQALDLLNAEARWFYTMHLQALGQYLDLKSELREHDEEFVYAHAVLLHYARWMAKHEQPILDTPERLQFPTETWAAQDMRKVEVFLFAARYAEAEERLLFLEKAEWFFQYVVRTLSEFPTRSLCRPVVLLMNFGWSLRWWKEFGPELPPFPRPILEISSFPAWTPFISQRTQAIQRAKWIALFGTLFGLAIVLAGLTYWLAG